MPKYVPTIVPQDIGEVTRHLDQEFNRIADAVTPDKWDHTHIHVDANYNAGAVPYMFADASGGAFSIFLPAPFEEMILSVKKVDATANAVTIDAGSNTIDGSSTHVITTQYAAYTLYWDKEENSWWIV